VRAVAVLLAPVVATAMVAALVNMA